MALYYAKIVSSQPELEREVARRLETAEQLRQATQEVDLANRAKSEFLAKMSHELRTPLNAVIGYSAMLLEDMEEAGHDQQCEDLEKIQHAGQHLLNLINDLLDLSKLDVGKMECNVEPLDVRTLIDDVTASYRGQITAGGNTLRVTCPGDVGGIEGDATKLGRALANLISNAAKFTQDGMIDITVSKTDEWLTITVADTGCGIDPGRLQTLFESFNENENATTSKYSEVSLGLPLSARLCRLMGGTLSVESRVGQGSRFQMVVPTSHARDAGLDDPARIVAAGLARKLAEQTV
jgi:signal transduction histidine kinase